MAGRTIPGEDNGLKQSQELPNSALTKTSPFPQEENPKIVVGSSSSLLHHSTGLGDPMGTETPKFCKAAIPSFLFHQIPLACLEATPAQQLCTVQPKLVKGTCPEHPGLHSSLQKVFVGSMGSSSRPSGEGNLPIQLTAQTLLLLIPAASQGWWGLYE